MDLQWNHKIFSVSDDNFQELALYVFRYQYRHNPVYKAYTDALKVDVELVNQVDRIPFLPIRFFKSHRVVTGYFEPTAIFESSGTTTTINSRHYIKDTDIYKESFCKCFRFFYGDSKEYCIIGLLPSYLERNNSSLVYMMNELIQQSGHPASGFYLNEWNQLIQVLQQNEAAGQKTILTGVTFALLDMAEKFNLPLRHTIIMETGGMKGRRKEMIREEVHTILKNAFKVNAIHSEYGMTELLSQAYSAGDGIYQCPPWMKILVRDDEDPLVIKTHSSAAKPVTGAVNIIDLANIYSCSFIATDDAARLFTDGSFEILGRLDNSDLRGCSLLAI